MVKKYRKKPIVIEALQLPATGPRVERHKIAMAFLGEAYKSYSNDGVYVGTLEGTMLASWGDFLIKGIQGEFYPCKPDIFRDTYDEVSDE